MRHEFAHVPGWKEWFESAEATTEEQVLLTDTNQMRISSAKKGEMNTEFLLFGDDTITIAEASYPDAKRMLDELEGAEVEVTIRTPGDDEETLSAKDAFVLHGYVKSEHERSPDPRPAIRRKCDAYFAFLEQIVCRCHEKFESS